MVGCGEVATTAHLPAYRACGYRIEIACDVDGARAAALARAFEIPRWTDRLEDVLDDEAVQIVDLAVPPQVRPALAKRIAAAGKHILAQKPLALGLDEAAAIVRDCQAAGVRLMVNHQARWAAVHRTIKHVIDQGGLGQLYSAVHVYRDWQDFPDSWFVKTPHATLLHHGIHYVDLARYFLDRTPTAVGAVATTVSGQRAVSPMHYSIVCRYEGASWLTSTLHFNNIVRARRSHSYEWLIDGTEGSVRATLEEVTYYPGGGDPVRLRVSAPWFPDAFGAAMGELISAIADERDPRPAGQDSLQTLAVTLAAVEACVTGRIVPVPRLSSTHAPGTPGAGSGD